MKTPKLIQRKRDGIFEASYYINGKRSRKSLGTTNKVEATVRFAQITGQPLSRTRNGFINIKHPSDNISYVDAVNKFIESKWGVKNAWMLKRIPQCVNRSTLAIGVLKRLQAFGNIKYVDDVTFDKLQGYVAHITHHGGINSKRMAGSSIVGQIGFIRRFLSYCVNMEYVNKNEANKLDKIKRKAPERYSFSKEEMQMILENALPRFAIFFELMLETGLRPCDMWNLTKDNFPGGNFVRIIQGKTGDKLHVPISERAQEIVSSLPHRLFPWADRSWTIEHDEMDQRVAVRNELRVCFAGDREEGCIGRGKAICRPKGIRLHTFRHTFAMWKLAVNTPLPVIKDLMGHRSVTMAELYASQMPKSALSEWV